MLRKHRALFYRMSQGGTLLSLLGGLQLVDYQSVWVNFLVRLFATIFSALFGADLTDLLLAGGTI